jgi:hypothetical protein
MIEGDFLIELSLKNSSSRACIFGFVDPVSFSTTAFMVEMLGDLDSVGDLSLIRDLVGTLQETNRQFFL